MAKNAISKTTTTTKAVAEIVKFDDMKGWGFEGLEQEDYATPRLKVLMALSPEITDETVPGAKPGMIYHSVTYTYTIFSNKIICNILGVCRNSVIIKHG